jgi:hypothetical protein
MSPEVNMKKIKVNLNELISEMEMGENMERSGYLDTETGEIIDMQCRPGPQAGFVSYVQERQCKRKGRNPVRIESQ